MKRPVETSQARGLAGHAVARPLLERGRERVVQRLLGEVEVAEQADQRGEHAARLGAIDLVDDAVDIGSVGCRGTLHALQAYLGGAKWKSATFPFRSQVTHASRAPFSKCTGVITVVAPRALEVAGFPK